MEMDNNNQAQPDPDSAGTTPTDERWSKARSGDIEAQWSLALELAEPAEPAGLVKVPLRTHDRRLFPTMVRSMKNVHPGLVDVFRRLTTGRSPWPLYLHGPVGAGKTRACLALCDYLETARYTTLRECCDAVMRGEDRPWRQGRRHYIDEPDTVQDLLVLDEIGARIKTGDLEHSTLGKIFEERERHGNGVAIYASNISPDDLAALYDDRIASRLLSGTVFRLEGSDRRQKA